MSTKRKPLKQDARVLEFVHGDPVEPKRETTEPKATTTGPKAQLNPPPAAAAPTPAVTAEPEPRRLNQSYRLPQPLVLRLQQVGLRRKHARLRPWSGQDIVAEALTRWLDEEEKRTP
jgi:hypothetical protein